MFYFSGNLISKVIFNQKFDTFFESFQRNSFIYMFSIFIF